jgi:hypothetical protein
MVVATVSRFLLAKLAKNPLPFLLSLELNASGPFVKLATLPLLSLATPLANTITYGLGISANLLLKKTPSVSIVNSHIAFQLRVVPQHPFAPPPVRLLLSKRATLMPENLLTQLITLIPMVPLPMHPMTTLMLLNAMIATMALSV